MAATEPTVLKVNETSQLLSVDDQTKGSKFSSLESREMQLQEDPLAQGYPAPDKSVTQQEAWSSKVPQFDVWEGKVGADNQYFDNVRKKIKIGNTPTPNQSDAPQPYSDDSKASEPSDNQKDDQIDARVRPLAKADDQKDYGVQVQMNHDIQAPAQAQAQAHPSPSKPEAQATVLRFGDFDVEVCCNQSFANVRKSINDGLSVPKPASDACQLICDVSEPPADNQVNKPELNGGKVASAVDPHTPATLSTWSKKRYAFPKHDRLSLGVSYDIGDKGLHSFHEPLGHARFPVLDEDLIDERGRLPSKDYGGGKKLLPVKQSDVKKTSGQGSTQNTPKKPSRTGWVPGFLKGGKKTTPQNK